MLYLYPYSYVGHEIPCQYVQRGRIYIYRSAYSYLKVAKKRFMEPSVFVLPGDFIGYIYDSTCIPGGIPKFKWTHVVMIKKKKKKSSVLDLEVTHQHRLGRVPSTGHIDPVFSTL